MVVVDFEAFVSLWLLDCHLLGPLPSTHHAKAAEKVHAEHPQSAVARRKSLHPLQEDC
jgi:hypothetical protein